MTGATDSIAAPVPGATRTSRPQTAATEIAGNDFWGDDGFTFDDFLDLINPLQHLPIISTLYRAATGDTISTGARVFGGALFGGVFGVFAAVFNAIVAEATGRDIGEHVLALFDGSDMAPSQASPTAVAASTPAGPIAVAASTPAGPIAVAASTPAGPIAVAASTPAGPIAVTAQAEPPAPARPAAVTVQAQPPQGRDAAIPAAPAQPAFDHRTIGPAGDVAPAPAGNNDRGAPAPWLSRFPRAQANFANAAAGVATQLVLDRLGPALDKYEISRNISGRLRDPATSA